MTEALKSSTAVRRFVVVQHDAHALFGLFSVSDGESIEAKAIDSVNEWIDQPEQDKIFILDTDTQKSSTRRGLTVYEVPSDFPTYDENDTSIDASSVEDGQIFENFRAFALVGDIVEAPASENIRVLVETEDGAFFVSTSSLEVDEDCGDDHLVTAGFRITGPGVDGAIIPFEEWIDEDGEVERTGGTSRWSCGVRQNFNDALPLLSEDAVDAIYEAIVSEIEDRKL